MKYRVRERLGNFNIEVNVKDWKGMWWWKESYYRWGGLTMWGSVMFHIHGMPSPPRHEGFSSLKKAQDYIKLLEKGTVYHYEENN